MSPAPLLSFYGDDLTGSTDAMEALELHGVRTVLFTDIPTQSQAQRFAGRRAVGIAGTSRSQSPDWMEANLPGVFAWLRGLEAPLCHYKVCSTFDSAPGIGSIGRAIDIGAAVFGQAATPLVVGAPQLKRYTAFGHLFAAFRGEIYRIDRHPVMSRHPVTPMPEADLAVHLSHQTEKPVGLVDLAALTGPDADAIVDRALAAFGIVLLDVADAHTQGIVGRALWRLAPRAPFVVGSSGVEYALVSDASGSPLSGGSKRFPPPGGRGPIAAVSGSVSATTERQIRHAAANGFGAVPLDVASLGGPGAEGAIDAAVELGSSHLAAGRSVVLHTALGPESFHHDAAATDAGAVGPALGRILDRLVRRHALKRACVSGGDTSGHAIRQLDLFALECLYPLPGSPGSPLCRAFSDDAALDGLEIAFKGGQIGIDGYFSQVRDG